MHPEDWKKLGYRAYPVTDNNRAFYKSADLFLQKRFDDQIGKMFYLDVFVYDTAKYPNRAKSSILESERYKFMPSAQFSLRDGKPFFNITMNGEFDSIDIVESQFLKFWEFLGRPYYEKFND